MRDRGKSGADEDVPRAYRGSVVDASEVLGHEDQLTLIDEDSDHIDQGGSASIDDTHESDQSSVSLRATVRPEASDRSAQSTLQSAGQSDTGVSSPDDGNAIPGHVPDAHGYRPPEPPGSSQPSGFRPRLDPLFYLIIGIAAAGLFLCLYALITQNDAYFEREYQQLQKESAALQARLAASAELQADLFAANQRALENKSQTQAVMEEERKKSLNLPADATVIAPVSEPEKTSPVEETTPEAVSDNPVAEVVAEPMVIEPDVVSMDQERVNDTVDPALVLLQQEVDALRDTLSRQEKIINRLERDNRDLNADRQTVSVQPPESDPVSTPVIESQSTKVAVTAIPVDTGRVADQAKTELNAVVTSVVSQSTPSLVTPLQNASEEVGDLINQGYLAYQSKDYNASADFYGKALEFDPYSRDANLGVAAIAQLNGDASLAADRYRHLLTLDPTDEIAFSALLNLSSVGGQGSIIEFELLQHAENIRETPALYAILGNYYSRQKRWQKASEFYAVALNRGAATPDYLFNYAVSLDNEGRPELAAEYYSQALEVVDSVPFSFDADAAKQRLESLNTAR